MITLKTAVQNMAGNNATGIKTGQARATAYAAARARTPVDLICLQETTVASLIRPTLDKLLKPRMRRVAGGKGRYIYARTDLKIVASGLITTKKSTWYKNDDKQAAWVIFETDGLRGMDVSYHLESASSADRHRLAQIHDILTQTETLAKKYQVPKHNIVLAGDANSTTQVTAFLEGRGYPNAAAGTSWENSETFIGWNGLGKRRVDYAHGQQATLETINPDRKLSDHAGLRVRRILSKEPIMNTPTLQAHLNELGFYVGRVDGIKGPRYREGIRRFQRAWNLGTALVVDGIDGPKTLAAIAETLKDGRISKHFKASELRCKCLGKYAGCLGVNVDRRDLEALEQLRSDGYPKGLQIISAYRCATHNARVGGASNSQHLYGKGFDIEPVLDVDDKAIPDRFKGRGYNKAKKVRHVDSRTSAARWAY